MQGDELMPGGQNVLARRARPHGPHRRGRDRLINPLKYLRKLALLKIGAHSLAGVAILSAVVVVVGESGDDPGAQLVGFRVRKLEGCDLLEMVVQEPGMVNQSQQDQGLAALDRRALAAHDRAARKLRARRLVGPAGQSRHRPLPASGREPAAGGGSAGGESAG